MRRSATPFWAVLIVCVLLLCGSQTLAQDAPQPDATPADALPEARAPGGLGTVRLPDDADEIDALFARLPDSVAGEPRTEPGWEGRPGEATADYGEADPLFGPPLSLGVQDVSTGEFYPAGTTAGDVAASVIDAPDYGAEAFGRDGDLVWVRASTTVGSAGETAATPTTSREIHTLIWGDADSPWVFSAVAPTRPALDDLVDAFVAAADADPRSGTPAAGATPEGGTPEP